MNSSVGVQGHSERSESSLRKSRLPIIYQTEIAECGLACIAMVLAWYGYATDVITLRKKFSVSSHGLTFRNLISICDALDLNARPLRIDTQDLGQLLTPCILHWDMNHYVVLDKVNTRHVIVHDPSRGRRKMEISEFRKHFTGFVLELFPADDFTPKKDKQKLTLKQFWSNVAGVRTSLIQIILLSLVLQFFTIISPLYMQIVIDDVLLRDDENLLIVIATGFALVLLLSAGVSVLREVIVLNLSNRLIMQMSTNLFRHLLKLPLDFFSKRHIGDVISRFGSLSAVRNFLTHGFVASIVDGIMTTITIVAMTIYSVKLTVCVLIFVLVYVFWRWYSFQTFRNLNEEKIIASANENTNFMESVRAIQTVKLFRLERDRLSRWQNLFTRYINADVHVSKWNIGYRTVNQIVFGLQNILVVFLAANLIMDDQMTVGMLFAFMSYKLGFMNALNSLITQWIDYKMIYLHLERVSDIAFAKEEEYLVDLDYESESSLTLQKLAFSKNIGTGFSVRNVSFRYAIHEKFVFDKLCFEIPIGKTTVIIGASGCGKTTLLKCLMGLYRPENGEIYFNKENIFQSPNYRKEIAGVLQNDTLMTGTILENITCFSPKADAQRVSDAAHLACIDEEINGMSMKYDTLIGDMGDGLSGGQKQRILLARALYRSPKVLFLDEATSNLDVGNERKIVEQIKYLDITCVVSAHRTETIQSADYVIDLSG